MVSPKKAVPNNEHTPIITVQIAIILRVMHPMIGEVIPPMAKVGYDDVTSAVAGGAKPSAALSCQG